jgi:hypothetical protein
MCSSIWKGWAIDAFTACNFNPHHVFHDRLCYHPLSLIPDCVTWYSSHDMADSISFSSFLHVACLVWVLALNVLFLNRKFCEWDIKILSQSGLGSLFVRVNKLCLVLPCVSFLYQRSLHEHSVLRVSPLHIPWSMSFVRMFLVCGTRAMWALCCWPHGP